MPSSLSNQNNISDGPINYSHCNAMEKRILMRRPLNPFAVSSLKKPTLRRFLRVNSQRYKNRDRKERLVQLISSMINRRASQAARRLAMEMDLPLPSTQSNTGPSSPPGLQPTLNGQSDEVPFPLDGLQEDFPSMSDDSLAVTRCTDSPTCDCSFTLDQIMHERAMAISESEQQMIADFMTKSVDEMKEFLRTNYDLNSSNKCRILLTKQLRDRLESLEALKLEQNLVVPSDQVSVSNAGVPEYCLTCKERPARAMMLPCKHVRDCVECAQGFTQCPYTDCNKEIEKIVRMFTNGENQS